MTGDLIRNLNIMEHISLDGVIQSSGEDDFPYADWTAPYRTPEGRDKLLARHGTRFDLLLGRRTYDIWSGYWPKAPSGPMADGINGATKYVVTHRPETLAWGPVEPVGADIAEGIRRIKGQVLRDNTTMLAMCAELGFHVAADADDPGIADVTLDLQ